MISSRVGVEARIRRVRFEEKAVGYEGYKHLISLRPFLITVSKLEKIGPFLSPFKFG